MNKKIVVTLIIVLTTLSIMLSVLLIYLLINNKTFNFYTKVSNELVINNTYEKEINYIDINSNASNIDIKTSIDDKFKIIVYGNKDEIKIYDNDNSLNINIENNKCFGFCFNNTIFKLEVYMPISYKGNIKINNNYGNIDIEEFKDLKSEINSAYGDIKISKIDTVNINSNYGNIKIIEGNNINIKQDFGDTNIDTVSNIDIEINYGDIKINNILEYINAQNDCGDIKINSLNLIKNSSITNNLGNIRINNTNEIYIDATVDLGNIKINNNYNKSDVTLKIDNDCGDITIRN